MSEVLLHEGAVEQLHTDGRDINPSLGVLSGEGSHQIAPAKPREARPWSPDTSATDPTYYNQPLLKRSVWTADIPLYYFLGGAAGSALALGAALQLRNDPELRDFSKRCHWIGIAGCTLGGSLLIHDLGRPSRFLAMVRVFRPTSPMNVGAWILSGAAPTAMATGLFINRGGMLGALGEMTGYLSGIFGSALAAYTGVLVANSAIPIWQQVRHWMPILFISSSMASAGSLLNLLYESEKATRIATIFGNIGRAAEIAAAKCADHAASKVPQTAAPFHSGAGSLLWKGATVLSAAGLVLSVLPGKSRARRRIASVLGVLGSLALRFAVHYISSESARDPRASFRLQRSRLEHGRDFS